MSAKEVCCVCGGGDLENQDEDIEEEKHTMVCIDNSD